MAPKQHQNSPSSLARRPASVTSSPSSARNTATIFWSQPMKTKINEAADVFRKEGVKVDAVVADLATTEGCDKLYAAIGGRPVDALLANAGRGLGHAFLDQDLVGYPQCDRYECHRHGLLGSKNRARHAQAQFRPYPDHRLHRRLRPWNLPGGLQRLESVSRTHSPSRSGRS